MLKRTIAGELIVSNLLTLLPWPASELTIGTYLAFSIINFVNENLKQSQNWTTNNVTRVRSQTQQERPILNMFRVLIADDSESNGLFLKKLIFEHFEGVEVLLVANGKEAFEAIKNSYFDIILMDDRMPVLNGPEAISRIRDYQSMKGQKWSIVFLVTTKAAYQDSRLLKEVGADDFLPKPVRPSLLQKKLSSYFNLVKEHSVSNPGHISLQYQEIPHFNKAELLNRSMHDEDLIRELLNSVDLQKMYQRLKNAIEVNDIETVNEATASLKGTCENLSFEKLNIILEDFQKEDLNEIDLDSESLKRIHREMLSVSELIKTC